jgi:hypothetical protein
MERTLDKPTGLLIRATLVAGTLDILSAMTYALIAGKTPLAVPVGIASAIWPGAQKAGVTAIYGLLLWAVMNLVVLPLRWPSLFPHFATQSLVEQLFSHIVLVGLPMAWMTGNAIRHT